MILVLASALIAPATTRAQDMPPQRQLRAYIPPDQLVSFLPSMPFSTFIELLNPTFERVTGKQLIDPDSRDIPIGIPIQSSHFFDAMELVLHYNGLAYRETDKYFIVQAAGVDDIPGMPVGVGSATDMTTAFGGAPAAPEQPATLATRQVRINAILFEVNHTKAKDTGLDWNAILGQASSQSGGGGAAGGQQSQSRVSFFLKTDDIFDGVDDLIKAPSEINFSDINSIIRFAESSGVGETIASPGVNVQSGVQGRIQVGSDVPIQTRDFSGNTITQFFSTGIIIEVTPTLITEATADTLGSPLVDFIHLDVKIEKSGSRPSASGPVIDRSSATTQVTMLDNEQIMIGGLYSTEESLSRSGLPVLKDLPGWFFGLRYLFGRTQRTTSQKELVIVLEAEVIDPIMDRVNRPSRNNTLDDRRDQVQQALERFNSRVAAESEKPDRYKEELEQQK
jgi:type IV pilus assembly protein PilQ